MHQLKCWILFVGLTGVVSSVEAQTGAIMGESAFANDEVADAYRMQYTRLTQETAHQILDQSMRVFHTEVRKMHQALIASLHAEGFNQDNKLRVALSYTLFVDLDGHVKLFNYNIKAPNTLLPEQVKEMDRLLNKFYKEKAFAMTFKRAFAYDGEMGL